MRKINLDILRGLAVIFVLFRHSDLSDYNLMKHFGWLGVDLFFVLSGYLISNILFTEYKKKQSINVSRFLIRRSFKIFPPFYIFMAITLLIYGYQGKLDFKWYQYLSETFYFQSYLPRIWLHTWSLAVEEHFYFSFVIIIILLLRKKLLENIQIIISTLVFLLILSFVMRLITSYPHRHDEFYGFMYTHLRSDGILIGILISYMLNFTEIKPLLIQYRMALLPVCFLLILPGFIFAGGSFFMNTLGLSLVNIGFGILITLSLISGDLIDNHFPFLNILLKPIAIIGEKSYSIYLWHMNAQEMIYSLVSLDSYTITSLYILFSILLGIIMWYLVEKPFEYIRDKITLHNTPPITHCA
jgi:peptidoglycan/LPS O-acetylase OafA/YrhL